MVDIWYKEERKNINGMDCYFGDCDCVYRGNLYVDRRPVGDYSVNNSEAVESIAEVFNIDFEWRD